MKKLLIGSFLLILHSFVFAQDNNEIICGKATINIANPNQISMLCKNVTVHYSKQVQSGDPWAVRGFNSNRLMHPAPDVALIERVDFTADKGLNEECVYKNNKLENCTSET
ncbi:hypothetical protein [Aquella oligotrophica]|uniref:Uncharacterized protein n=1 Tax=Aquella oligotrophica TaxID=2067065 RepID=A0A2I7N5G6_9NEIS|nr:hypothetical protein [Aquella oligotrophica]AUR51698.1 hypothetical protein CUN60_05115 [Aquella oligotrophica]